MKNRMKNAALLVLAMMALGFAVWGPEALTRYRDRQMFDEVHLEAVEEEGEGYRYKLGSNERLYILAECLNSQRLSAGVQGGLTGGPDSLTGNPAVNTEYQQLGGNYAFVVNHRGPAEDEIPKEGIFEACEEGLSELKKLGILLDSVRKVEDFDYDAVLYSAIDVLEPRNNVAVWKVSLSDSQKNVERNNRLIEAYLDADSGKIYEFYVRTSRMWSDVNPDALIKSWGEYLGLGEVEYYDSDNPLLETTPYFKKYVFEGMEEEKTVVTVGFYEGINEIFLKITQ